MTQSDNYVGWLRKQPDDKKQAINDWLLERHGKDLLTFHAETEEAKRVEVYGDLIKAVTTGTLAVKSAVADPRALARSLQTRSAKLPDVPEVSRMSFTPEPEAKAPEVAVAPVVEAPPVVATEPAQPQKSAATQLAQLLIELGGGVTEERVRAIVRDELTRAKISVG